VDARDPSRPCHLSLRGDLSRRTGNRCTDAFAAVATTLIQRGLRRSNFYAGSWINIAVGVIGLWSAGLVLVPFSKYNWRAVPYFVFSGVVGTSGGRFLRVLAIQKVGASVAAAINNLAPLIATVLDLPPKIWTIWGFRSRPQVRSSPLPRCAGSVAEE